MFRTRKPLPALLFLLALALFSTVVWWRILHRTEATASGKAAISTSASCSPTRKAAFPKPATVTVTVLNSTQTVGLATSVSADLKSRGFATSKPGDGSPGFAGVGEIRYGPTAHSGAALLSYHLPGVKLVPINRVDSQIDIVLGAQFRALAKPADVAAAVDKAERGCL